MPPVLRAILLLSSSTLLGSAAHADGPTSAWVTPTAQGKLAYKADLRGNTIPDFSRAGYGGGGVKLPDVSIVARLKPMGGGDDGARIQAALDSLAQRPADARGWRGALLLERGTYRVEGSLVIPAGGVVLRGEGAVEGDAGTTIRATGKKQRTLIQVAPGRVQPHELEGSRRRVSDPYVSWSAKSFSVESVEGLKVGDRVVIHRPSTEAWIRELGMDRI